MLTYYGTQISEHMTDTPEGYLICRDVPINRTGVQDYLAGELGLNGEPSRVVSVRREPEDVFDEETLASFEGKDVTQEHPSANLTADTQAMYSKGHIQNVRRVGDMTVADLLIKDPVLIDAVKSGRLREVSCGYDCQLVQTADGYKQTHIIGNHVAIVPRGRAGSGVAIQDKKRGGKAMEKFLEGMLNVFGKAAKEAESADELNGLTKSAVSVLDACGSTQQQDAGEIPKGDDLGTKLDAILARLEMLEGKMAERDTKTEDAPNPEQKEDPKSDDDGNPDEEPKSVETADTYAAIMRAAEANAKKMSAEIRDEDKIIAEIQSAYNARNPHKKEA